MSDPTSSCWNTPVSAAAPSITRPALARWAPTRWRWSSRIAGARTRRLARRRRLDHADGRFGQHQRGNDHDRRARRRHGRQSLRWPLSRLAGPHRTTKGRSASDGFRWLAAWFELPQGCRAVLRYARSERRGCANPGSLRHRELPAGHDCTQPILAGPPDSRGGRGSGHSLRLPNQ